MEGLLFKIIAGFSFIAGIFIFAMFFHSFPRIKEIKVLLDVAMAFLLASFVFITHALVDMLGLEDGYYATTGLMFVVTLAYIIILLRYKSPISFNHGGKK